MCWHVEYLSVCTFSKCLYKLWMRTSCLLTDNVPLLCNIIVSKSILTFSNKKDFVMAYNIKCFLFLTNTHLESGNIIIRHYNWNLVWLHKTFASIIIRMPATMLKRYHTGISCIPVLFLLCHYRYTHKVLRPKYVG